MDIASRITELRAELETINNQTQAILGTSDDSNPADLSEEQSNEMATLLDRGDQIIDEISNLRTQQRVERQQQTLATSQFLVNAGNPQDPGATPNQPSATPQITATHKPGVQQRAARITMRRHHGGLKVFKSEAELELAFQFGNYLNAFINRDSRSMRWCRDHGVGYDYQDAEGRVLNQHVEKVNPAGAVLVPTEISDRVIRLVDEYGVYEQDAYIEPMGSDAKTIWRRKKGLKASHIGEAQPTPTTDPDLFDKVGLVAKIVSALTSISKELDMDSLINVVDVLVQEAALAFALRHDTDGFFGKQDSESGGIWGLCEMVKDPRYAAAAYKAPATHDTFMDINQDDITQVLARFPAYGLMRPGAAWYMSNWGYQQIVGRLELSLGGTTPTDMATPTNRTLRGWPVRISEVFPSTNGSLTDEPMLAFANLMLSSTMGTRTGLSFSRSDHHFFDTREIAVLFDRRVDQVNHNLVDPGDPSKAGPCVVLVGGDPS